MDAGLLSKIFGHASDWHGSGVVLVDAETSVKAMGNDSIVTGGAKSYAPRITSGRVLADAICYSPENHALFAVQRTQTKHHTGETVTVQTLIVIDAAHVAGLEFEHLDHLSRLGLKQPPLPDKPHYAAGTLVG